jgi:Spy/CpxP family protein refolding chaperone
LFDISKRQMQLQFVNLIHDDMKKTMIRSAGILFLGIVMSVAVNAQPSRQGGRGPGHYGAGEGPRMQSAKLELTEEQQEEMTSLRTRYFKEITPLRNKMAELKAGERTLLSEEDVDMDAVNRNIDQQTELSNTMKKLQVQHQVAVKEILTDEQVMQLQQRRQFAQRDNFNRNDNHRGNRMGRGYRGL